MKKVSLLLILLCSISVRAMDDSKTVITVELDGIVSNQEHVSFADFSGMVKSPRLLWKAASLLKCVPQLAQDFRDIESSTHGIANVFYALASRIRANQNVDITSYAPDLIARFTKPTVNADTLNNFRKLRNVYNQNQ